MCICHTLDIRDHHLVNTSTLVAYQGKIVSLNPERESRGMTSDNILTVYNSTPDN